MNRRTLIVSVACCCLTITLAVSVCAQEVKLSAAQPKITTASAVRARTGPQVAAEEIMRLTLQLRIKCGGSNQIAKRKG